MVARREVDVVGRIAPGGRAHVLRIERVLEREDDAVYRHLVEIGVAPVSRIELRGAFESIGQLAEVFADRRRAPRQRSLGGVPVELAAAGHRPFTPDVERRKRVELSGIRDAGDHSELLLYRRIGRSRLHAAKFERRTLVLFEIGENRRGLDGLGREAQRRRRAHRPRSLGYRSPIFRHEAAAHPVIGPRPVDIMLDDGDAGRAAGPDCLVQLIDRRLFESEWLVVGHRLALTPLDRSWRRTTRPANRHRSNRGGRNIARSAVSWAFRAGGTDAQKGDHVRNA